METFCRKSGDKYFWWHNFSWRAIIFNKENMEFWVINICFFTIKEYSVHGLEICILVNTPLITRIIIWNKSISLLVPEFHCLDNGDKNICATLFTGVVWGESETLESTFIFFKTQYKCYVTKPSMILHVPLSVTQSDVCLRQAFLQHHRLNI